MIELPDMEYGTALGTRGQSEYTQIKINIKMCNSWTVDSGPSLQSMNFLFETLILGLAVPTRGLVMIGDDFRSMILHLPIMATWDGDDGWVWVANLNNTLRVLFS
jgi:hypothetical protein